MELFWIIILVLIVAAVIAFFARTRAPGSNTVIIERDRVSSTVDDEPVEREVVERPTRSRVVETERTYTDRP